jgi:hypothetical protein
MPPPSPTTIHSKSLLALHLLQQLHLNQKQQTVQHCASRATQTQLLLDAAHEVILGVSWDNMDDAEEYSVRRKQQNRSTTQRRWIDRHPLDETDDFVHSIIHRLEGGHNGEGGHTGYDNAKYWISGGPKHHPTVPTHDHPVYQTLCELYRSLMKRNNVTTLLPSFVHDDGEVKYEIVAGGGTKRIVLVQPNCWDGIAVIDAWEQETLMSTAAGSITNTDAEGRQRQQQQLRLLLLMKLHRLEIQLWTLFELSNRTLPKEQLMTEIIRTEGLSLS